MYDLLLISVTSGLIAGVSSCTLPMYPILLNIISRNSRHRMVSTVFFVSGMAFSYVLVYTLLAVVVIFCGWGAGESVDESRSVFFVFAALISFFFALDTLVHLNIFQRTLILFNRVDYSGDRGTFLSGVSFGSVITPCSAPFLITGIMPVLASKVTFLQGMVLITLFSVSLGFPLLMLGLSSAVALDKIRRLQRNTANIEFLSALFLVSVGVYFLGLYLQVV